MIPNCNNGTQAAPCLRPDFALGCLDDLPEFSRGPKGAWDQTLYNTLSAAGYKGIQGGDPTLCRNAGLHWTGGGRVNEVGEIDALARRWADEGQDCATLHVGWGIESPDKMLALCEDIVRASEKHNIPLYVETHRATITQDMWRTVWLTEQLPEIRFNADLSHWYTGLEMVYGDIAAKWEFLKPVFDRVRFFHGRIGNPGTMQVDIGDGTGRSYVDHFKEMWTRCMVGFLATARPGDYVPFAPELLCPKIYYAQTYVDGYGIAQEFGDRWTQARLLTDIALACFDEAKRRHSAPKN